MEEQTAQITRVSLLVGVTPSRPVALPGLAILFICEPVPLLKAGTACFGKAFAGKRPQAQLLRAHWLLCYYPEVEEGRSLQTADEVCDQECLHTKEPGSGEGLAGWWVVLGQVYFRRVEKGEWRS